jgi:hypothetical protein
VIFNDNFQSVQPPKTEIKMDERIDRFFETSNYKYDGIFCNTHTSYGGVDIHRESLCRDIKIYHESINIDSTADETSITSETTSIHSTGRSILSINEMQILHSRNIYIHKTERMTQNHTHICTV